MQKIHVERLRILYSVMAGIPSAVIDMDGWRFGKYEEDTDKKFIRSAVEQINENQNEYHRCKHYSCGTAACALGWACAYPEFKKQGLKFKGGNPTFPGVYVDSFGWSDGFEVGSKFFGISYLEAEDLFVSVDYQIKDREHKKVFLDRLRELLVKKNIITEQRAQELKAQEPLYN